MAHTVYKTIIRQLMELLHFRGLNWPQTLRLPRTLLLTVVQESGRIPWTLIPGQVCVADRETQTWQE